MLREEARCAAAFRRGTRAHDVDVAGREARRLLAAGLLEVGARAPRLGEVELAAVKAPRTLEVVHVVVDAFESLDTEGFWLGHGNLTSPRRVDDRVQRLQTRASRDNAPRCPATTCAW